MIAFASPAFTRSMARQRPGRSSRSPDWMSCSTPTMRAAHRGDGALAAGELRVQPDLGIAGRCLRLGEADVGKSAERRIGRRDAGRPSLRGAASRNASRGRLIRHLDLLGRSGAVAGVLSVGHAHYSKIPHNHAEFTPPLRHATQTRRALPRDSDAATTAIRAQSAAFVLQSGKTLQSSSPCAERPDFRGVGRRVRRPCLLGRRLPLRRGEAGAVADVPGGGASPCGGDVLGKGVGDSDNEHDRCAWRVVRVLPRWVQADVGQVHTSSRCRVVGRSDVAQVPVGRPRRLPGLDLKDRVPPSIAHVF